MRRGAARFARQPIPPQVMHHARRALIDWHAALYPVRVLPPATLLEKALAGRARPRRSAPRARQASHRTRRGAHQRDRGAYRGARRHLPRRHLSPGRADHRCGPGFGRQPNLLRSIVVGYEISTRIGAAMGRAHYRYWHNTGTIGCFGAAAAAAEALGLDAGRFAHALATVATFSAGLQQAFRMDSMSKPLHAGHAAEAGVLAALAAREGVTGSLDVMEGEAGYGRAMGDDPDWEKAFATLGEDFHITRMTFKNHACCGHTFAAIDGALALKKAEHARLRRSKQIEVGHISCGRSKSRTTKTHDAGRGPLLAEVRRRHGTHPRKRAPCGIRKGGIEDPATRALMKRIQVVARSAARRRVPGAARGAGRDPRRRTARGAPAAARASAIRTRRSPTRSSTTSTWSSPRR